MLRSNCVIIHTAATDSTRPITSVRRAPIQRSSSGTEMKATSEPSPRGMLA